MTLSRVTDRLCRFLVRVLHLLEGFNHGLRSPFYPNVKDMSLSYFSSGFNPEALASPKESTRQWDLVEGFTELVVKSAPTHK